MKECERVECMGSKGCIDKCWKPQRTWVGLTDMEIDQGLCRTNYAMQTSGAWRDGVEWASKQLQERNS